MMIINLRLLLHHSKSLRNQTVTVRPLQNQFFSMSHFSKEVDKLWASSYVQQLFDT